MGRIIFNVLITILGVFLFIAFVLGLYSYEESKWIYTLFSIVFFTLLLSALYKTITYSYSFLAIFLFLGFWFKLTLHLILGYSYIEPVGYFYTYNTSMDDVLIVSMIGAIGILFTYVVFKLFKLNITIKIVQNKNLFNKELIYDFYKKYKCIILYFMLFVVSIVSILNFFFNIQMSGVVPSTILLFPLNALTYWMFSSGFMLIFAYFIYLEIEFDKKLNTHMILLFLLVCAICSISILSRGTFVFLFIGLIFFILYNYKYFDNYKFSDFLKMVIIAILFYLIVIYVVTILRDFYFSDIDVFDFSNKSGMSGMSGVSGVFLGLIVDRWIGLEGVMAVASYPLKSFDLFYEALVTEPKIGDIDIYQYISNAHYKDMDNIKYTFATIPGSVAFFFYSGYYSIVFLGMTLLVSMMIFIEKLILVLSKSTLFASLLGVSLASSVAQFGLAPVNLIKSLAILFCFLICLNIFEYTFNKINK